jgi:hypothetical protein
MQTEDTAFIATLDDGSGYVLIVDGKVVSTHATAAEAVKARDALEFSIPE